MIRVKYEGKLISQFSSYSEVLNKILSYNELCISIFSVDEWIDESNILETYYDLYFKKR